MSTSYKGVLVYFDRDASEEYIEKVTEALRLVGNVHDVVPVPDDPGDYITEQRLRQEISEQRQDIAWPERARRRKAGER